jgi:stage II sporulation protein D
LLLLLPLFLALQLQAQLPREPATIRIGVLSLFHPRTLTLTADHPITLLLDGAPRILDPHHIATLRATSSGVEVDATPIHTLALPPETFTLAVPGKLTRTYRGALTVTSRDQILIPVITMATELAVASILAAEAPPGAPLEALKAQAIASRSFLLANPHTHRDFDACDTTHCQYLRSPPAPSSPAALATRATLNVVLTWRPSPEAPLSIVAAMYSRSCGGQTRVPTSSDGTKYPYYSVRCDFCRRHPELWSRPADTPEPTTEQARIVYNRTHGWSAIPSNTHAETESGLEGRGTGHGIGLCQLGAADLAQRGETYAQILAHYYPNTALATLP